MSNFPYRPLLTRAYSEGLGERGAMPVPEPSGCIGLLVVVADVAFFWQKREETNNIMGARLDRRSGACDFDISPEGEQDV